MFVIAPNTCAIVESIVFPVLCKNLSYTVNPIAPTDKEQHIFKYIVPIVITCSLPLAKSEINHFEPKIPNNKNIIYKQTLKNIPFPATLFTFSVFFSPKLFERSAFNPTPVPTPTAIISICIGNAIVSA